MKMKNVFEKMLRGLSATLLAALLATSVLPAAAGLAVSASGVAFDALEIFPQEANALTPRTGGATSNDTRTFDAGLPPSTTVLFVIGGTVNSINATTGEWLIGSNPQIAVYEATGSNTTISGNISAGDEVRVVGKRTLTPGPVVAQYITLITPGPQPLEAPGVTTALLFNGTAITAGATTWTVMPAVGASVNFNILADAGPLGVGPTHRRGTRGRLRRHGRVRCSCLAGRGDRPCDERGWAICNA